MSFKGGGEDGQSSTRIGGHVSTVAGCATQWHTMIEYEYRVLVFPRDVPRGDVRRALAEHAEYGHWEMDRLRLYLGGGRRVWLRRRIIRVQRTA